MTESKSHAPKLMNQPQSLNTPVMSGQEYGTNKTKTVTGLLLE